jgi:hypothetical protein
MHGFRLYIRRFLNRPGMNAGAHVIVEVPERASSGDEPAFILADCSRTVRLDFGTYTEQERENALYKAELLVEAITRFRDALIAYCAEVDAEDRRRGRS